MEQTLTWMAARRAITFAVIIVALVFVVSSPRHLAFWIVLGALAVVLAPYLFALAWFHVDARRLRRERDPPP